MKIVFLSNFFDHHQKELSDELYKATFGSYTFVATEKMAQERVKLGYDPNDKPLYVKEFDLKDRIQWDSCEELAFNADVVLIGSAPESLVSRRVKAKKLTFKYRERLFKNKLSIKRYLATLYYHINTFWFKRNYYLLCASAYTYRDFLITGCFYNRAFKWGYFPPMVEYGSIGELLSKKEKHSLLWVGRHIDWKHPEYAVWLAKRLKEEGIVFHLNIVGTGPLIDTVKKYIEDNSLEKEVSVLGSMHPTRVREFMEQAEVFINTSDRNEGWGAVINEAMNSACAVVVNNLVGSAPFLIQNNQNGVVYKDGDFEDFYQNAKSLITDIERRKFISNNAYLTIVKEWNARTAAINFLSVSNSLLNQSKNAPVLTGPCSKANIVKSDWYK